MENYEICKGLNRSAKQIYQNNAEKGFWDEERNVGELLMLVTTELAEAMDAHQKGVFADWKNFWGEHDKNFVVGPDNERVFKAIFEGHIKNTFEDEIADAIIRLLDLCGGLGIDIEKHIQSKVRYNKTRERLHGKKY